MQLARHMGAFVATTARSVNHGYVTGYLGADLAIDYTKEDPAKAPGYYDAALDAVGGQLCEAQCFAVLRPGGRAAFVVSGLSAPPAPRPDILSLRPSVARSSKAMDRMSALLREGAWRPPYTTLRSKI